MHIIGTLLIGLIVGAVAKLLMPGKDPGGFIITILLVSPVHSWQRILAESWVGTRKARQPDSLCR